MPANATILITLGTFKNPLYAYDRPNTFLLTSYDSTFTYTYDYITYGLRPDLNCAYPCKTCLSGTTNCAYGTTDVDCITYYNKSMCLTCHTEDINNYVYYYNYTCISSCPGGTYAGFNESNATCLNCSYQCGTCVNNYTCASCNATSDYPYYYKNNCYSECPFGTF